VEPFIPELPDGQQLPEQHRECILLIHAGTRKANLLRSVEITLNWSFTIQMKEISAVDATSPGIVPGGLTVVLGDVNVPTEAHQEGHDSGWGSAQSTPDGAANDIAAAVKSMNISQIATDIVGGISGLGHFVLPGNGTFKMTNPVFNNNGDLLCHLEYLPTAPAAI
jgi:hypothetical protein